MLVLRREPGEQIIIGDKLCVISLENVRDGKARLLIEQGGLRYSLCVVSAHDETRDERASAKIGLEADISVSIHRKEVFDQIEIEKDRSEGHTAAA